MALSICEFLNVCVVRHMSTLFTKIQNVDLGLIAVPLVSHALWTSDSDLENPFEHSNAA